MAASQVMYISHKKNNKKITNQNKAKPDIMGISYGDTDY